MVSLTPILTQAEIQGLDELQEGMGDAADNTIDVHSLLAGLKALQSQVGTRMIS